MAVEVEKELLRLVDGLAKVYSEKNPDIELDVTNGIRFRGESGDFMEIAGNLLDNACKWCSGKVVLTIRPLGTQDIENGNMSLVVEDDGPGIPEDAADALLQRGMRLDESAPGHGIGLAVVKEIAASYGGGVSIEKSPLGGARIQVEIRPTKSA
jgi:two-component system sensor histidine kinase PhoQ